MLKHRPVNSVEDIFVRLGDEQARKHLRLDPGTSAAAAQRILSDMHCYLHKDTPNMATYVVERFNRSMC